MGKIEQNCEEVKQLLLQKNEAYGSSAHETFKQYGLMAYLVRMQDKLNRLHNLYTNPNIDSHNESLVDTLRDLAGYAILALSEVNEPLTSNALLDHAKMELDRMLETAKREDEEEGNEDGEGYKMQKAFNDGVYRVIKEFSKGGHSGFSANMAISYIDRLLKFRPLTSLTFEDDEWAEVSEGVYQNKRASNVFKEEGKFNGEPYCIDGPNGEVVSLKEYPYAYLGNFTPKEELNVQN